MHCHIDWHNLGGMAMTWIEGEKELRSEYGSYVHNLERCTNHH